MDNYAPWEADLNTLSAPKAFLSAAILAPSSHNSQPWTFTVRGDVIDVQLAKERLLPESDTNDRQAVISLGCAIANVELLADYRGYDCAVTPSDGMYATLTFSKRKVTAETSTDHLALFINERKTNRSAHETRKLDAASVDEILRLAQPGIRIDLIIEPKKKVELGGVAIAAGIEALDNPGFRRELSAYLKPNDTLSPIGMPGSGFGFPAPMARIAPWLVRRFNMERASRRKNETLFKHTSGILVISTTEDTPAVWINVGRIYERIALIAARAGMSTSPWGATVQIGEHYRDVQRLLGISERPQLFCRIGYPSKSAPHTPRLSIEDVVNL